MLSATGPARVRRWFEWSVGLAVLAQLALFAWATAPGLAGTADSGFYLHAAGTLRTAGHLLNPDGSTYRYWPPLYPVLVALGGSLGTLRLLHGLALGLSLLAWSQLGRRLLPAGWALVLPWALALSTPWLVVSKFVWGEVVFLALVAGYVLALFRWLHTRQRQWWGLATALGFLLPLHRTPGFFLLAGVALGLLLEWKSLLRKQWLPLAGHLALSVLGGIAWHVYALLIAAPTVYRLNRGWAQFFSSTADYGFVLSRWLAPVRAAWRPEVPIIWALALVGLLAWLWPKSSGPVGAEAPEMKAPIEASPWPKRFPRVLWVSSSFFILLLIIATTFTRSASGLYDAERYVSVLFGPVILLVLRRMGRWFEAPSLRRRWGFGLAVAVVGVWLAYAAGRSISNAAALRQLPPLGWTSAH
ncbi:hypothetical protein [Hymenobacter sedentarius]|uniref:hypothetical protein n=1 Tax=Hymenobacter sedentarius TaxID=1411621 RepID=UPI000A65351C|nr:hypothetical protein [Hymenobacter sedentarius]